MGSNTPKNSRPSQTAADQKLIDGLNKHAATITVIVIAGVTMATKDIISTLQQRIAASTAAETTRATWQAAVVADEAEREKTRQFISGLRQALLAAFAGQVDALADFGLTPRKAVVLTPDEKVARAAKAKATRAARHTMGKVQKSKITGDNPTGAPPVSPAGGPPPTGTPATPPASPSPATPPAVPAQTATGTPAATPTPPSTEPKS
ncbi:MAG TPA: hypothetical protein VGG39_15920 [Polyangiaceae bacterium]|jgi:hypothetical protein